VGPVLRSAGGAQEAGPEIVIAGKDVQNIALALHELATNAAKYGALTAAEGKINVSWTVEQSGSDKFLIIRWQERGGPLTTAPRRNGFGTTLLSTVFSETSLDYALEGMSCRFSLRMTPRWRSMSARACRGFSET
jgi:two-component sensor histidine kinase